MRFCRQSLKPAKKQVLNQEFQNIEISELLPVLRVEWNYQYWDGFWEMGSLKARWVSAQ